MILYDKVPFFNAILILTSNEVMYMIYMIADSVMHAAHAYIRINKKPYIQTEVIIS